MKTKKLQIIRRTVLLFTLLATTLFVSSQGLEEIRKIISIEKRVPVFEYLCIEGNFNIFIVEGTAQKVIIETEEKQVNNVVTNVSNGCLYVFCYHKLKKETAINIFVTVKELNKITLAGKSNISLLSKIEDVDIYMETASSILDLGISSSKFNFNVYGKGNVNIKGNFENFGFSINDEINLKLDVKTNILTCKVTEMAEAKLSGICDDFTLVLSDEGVIQSTGLVTKKCSINITDSGEAYVSVLEKLNIKGLLDGFVEYRGEPSLNIEAAKTVSIKYKKDKMFASEQ